MRIDGQPNTLDINQTGATGRVSEGQGGARGKAVAPSGDRVELSSDAKLLNAALSAASTAPPVRSDRVEAVKQKLANGELGSDADRLAGRMLSDLLGE